MRACRSARSSPTGLSKWLAGTTLNVRRAAENGEWSSMVKPSSAGCLICAILCTVAAGMCPGTPADRGAFEILEVREHLVDVERGRELDVLVLVPAPSGDVDAPEEGFPLIVFCHGFLLRGELYRSYGEHLASHGFAVVLPTLPMSLLGMDHRVLAADVRTIIDQLLATSADPESHLTGLIDASRIGTCGHSLGGKIAVLEAVDDVRICAIGLLDPVDGGGPGIEDPVRYPSVAPEMMPDIDRPLLFIGAELGGLTNVFTPCAPVAENYQRFYEAANPPAIEVTQLGAGHGQYVDPGVEALMASCAPGTADAVWVRSSAVAYLTAFFQWWLEGDEDARRWLDARFETDEREERVLVRRK